MQFNRNTFICLALMLAGGLFLTQADLFLSDYQLYICKLFFIKPFGFRLFLYFNFGFCRRRIFMLCRLLGSRFFCWNVNKF